MRSRIRRRRGHPRNAEPSRRPTADPSWRCSSASATRPSPGLLSFPEAGATLALDFPEHGEATAKLFANLDAIVRAAGGRIYPAKDAHMGGEFFRACYPQWTQLEALRDPALCSRFWKRVTQA